MNEKSLLGGLSGVARPSPSMWLALRAFHGRDVEIPIQQALDETEAILGLEALLSSAEEAHPGDRRCQAAFILAAMKAHSK